MCPIKPLEIECTQQGVAMVITLSGHISTHESQVVSENLERLVSDQGSKVIVDMEKVDLITSDGLGALIRARKSASEAGGTMVLSGIQGNILDVFRMTRLDKIFSLYETIDDAVAALSK